MNAPAPVPPRPRLPFGHLVRIAVAVTIVLTLAASVARGGSTATAPANTASPSVGGTAQQGQTLSATPGTWTGDAPIVFTYQWQRCDAQGGTCGSIAGASSSTHTAVAGDVGGTLRVVVTATNGVGTSSAASAPTAVVATPGNVPSLTKQPDPHGTFQVGQTITVDTGTWSGTTPITYSYQWQRCSAAGGNCADVSGATSQTFLLSAADLGGKLRAVVTAKNSAGSTSASSNLTPTVAAPGVPTNTVPPTVATGGGLTAGTVATATAGTWLGDQPISFTYSWSTCDATGKNCRTIAGETKVTHLVADSEAGATLVVTVRASNARGAATASSAPTTPIKASGLPAGAIRLADGKVSIPAGSVTAPQRLVISSVTFSPTHIRTRTTFTTRFRVTDSRGYVVRDALVYIVGLPYSYVRSTSETPTGSDGYAVINVTPTSHLPLTRGAAIVFFVRARKAGDPILAGVSSRRLVQVTVTR
jgi:hypothetical protein